MLSISVFESAFSVKAVMAGALKKMKKGRESVRRSAPKASNPVAKHARQFQRSSVFRDRKREEKRGYFKHKKAGKDAGFFLAVVPYFYGNKCCTASLSSRNSVSVAVIFD